MGIVYDRVKETSWVNRGPDQIPYLPDLPVVLCKRPTCLEVTAVLR